MSFVFGSLPYFCKSTEFFLKSKKKKKLIQQRHKILSRLLLFISSSSSSSSIKRDKSTIRTNERRRRRRRGSFLCRGDTYFDVDRTSRANGENRKQKRAKRKEITDATTMDLKNVVGTVIKSCLMFTCGYRCNEMIALLKRGRQRERKNKSSTMVDDICERAVKFAEEDLTETGDDHCQIDCSRKPYDNSTNGDDSNELIKRSFPVNRNKTALVIIDMQEDFLSKEGRLGKFYSEETLLRLEKTIKNVEELLGKARECGMTVAHSRSHRYGAQVRRDLLNGIDVMTKNSPIDGVDKTYNFVKECMPIEGEIIVDKWTFGAFASTDLEMKLRERGVERILLCGILTNVCVFATAVQAVDRFFRVCLVEDCCGAFGDGWHEKAVELINGPQIAKKNHHKSVGLYFGEVASLENACAALNTIVK